MKLTSSQREKQLHHLLTGVKEFVTLVDMKSHIFRGNEQFCNICFKESNKTVRIVCGKQLESLFRIAMCGKRRVLCFCRTE